ELFTTTCVWQGDRLTVYEPSQFVYGLKNGVAQRLGVDADNVRVVSHFVGGAFGSKGGMTPRTALIALPRARSTVRSSWSPPAIRASPSRPIGRRRTIMCGSVRGAMARWSATATRAGR